jgi:capsular polysaccharide biosynthesis protein
MNETSIGLALIGRLLRKRWVVFTILAVLGACLGAASSLVLSPGYVSTAKVLLQGSRNPTEVPGETQIATSLIVLDHAAADLGLGVPGSELANRVSAEIVSGNVLVITGSGPTPQAAQQLADKITAEYVAFSTQIITDATNASNATTDKARAALQQKIDDANKRLTEIQGSPAVTAQGTEGDQARAEMQQQQRIVGEATKQLGQIDAATETTSLNQTLKGANVRIIQMATLPAGQSAPTLWQLAVAGAAAFVVLGLLAHLIALRTDKRLRRAQDMAAAAGAPVLAVVTVPRRTSAPTSPVRRILRDDRRWAAEELPAEDVRGRDARYQRLLSRLPTGDGPAVLLAVLPAGDRLACDALVDLAVVAAAGPTPVTVVTEDDELTERVAAEAEAHGLGSALTAAAAMPGAGALVLVVAVIAAGQPIVSTTQASDGALLLTEAGTRTGWELAGIAGACGDAGQPLLGLVTVVSTAADGGVARKSTDVADPTLVGSP